MSPMRWDVLLVGFVLALPLLALGARGDLTTEEVVTRLPWCLLAGWGVVALIRAVGTPRTEPAEKPERKPFAADPSDADAEEHPSPAV
ncbi:MAG TPA: hypothetical protein VK402_15165 [Blastococcus sp.]|nr:hypothetical protein [Blastococcus sp.]